MLKVGKITILVAIYLFGTVMLPESGDLLAQQNINKLKKEQSNLKKKIKNTDAKLTHRYFDYTIKTW